MAGYSRCSTNSGLLPPPHNPSSLPGLPTSDGGGGVGRLSREEVELEGGRPPAWPWTGPVPREAALLCWQTGAMAPRGSLRTLPLK